MRKKMAKVEKIDGELREENHYLNFDYENLKKQYGWLFDLYNSVRDDMVQKGEQLE